ncbi:hypothetical protein RRF57_010335 [Xylaria bambusicola]|uniref:Uncharacterized protein n=1 Tax=Xylaria bambusicola TaxID=326684 RepID=A0AAN7Z8G1_9PEZI
MCLVRMVVAMGWPPRQPNEENPQPVIEEPDGPPYAAFAHGDLFVDRSIGNIMVGELAPNDPNSEHARTSYLTLYFRYDQQILASMATDALGRSHTHVTPYRPRGNGGAVMIELIALDHTKGQIAYNRTETHSSVRVNGKGPFPTFGEDLLRQDDYGGLVYPWLDRRMRALVSECLAQDPDMRSDPRALLEDIKSMVRDRNGEYYANQPAHDNIEESDEAIRRILDTVLNNA